jgi:hypothetical protein
MIAIFLKSSAKLLSSPCCRPGPSPAVTAGPPPAAPSLPSRPLKKQRDASAKLARKFILLDNIAFKNQHDPQFEKSAAKLPFPAS